jgi:hypothetical protein
MLTCTASLIPRGTMDVTVNNHYSDFEISKPLYFCERRAHDGRPIERIGTGNMTKIGFRFGSERLPSGILIYELRRKGNVEPDYRLDVGIISLEPIEDISRIMQLLVIWKFDPSEEVTIHVMLVEHSNELTLNEDKLEQLYNKIDNQLPKHSDSRKRTWLVTASEVLAVTYKVIHEEDFKLKIDISEGVVDKDTIKPIWIDPYR